MSKPECFEPPFRGPIGTVRDGKVYVDDRVWMEWLRMLLAKVQSTENISLEELQDTVRNLPRPAYFLDEADGADSADTMLIPGPQGAQGPRGLAIPGMDGADGDDSGAMQPPGAGGNAAQFTEVAARTMQTQGYTVATLPAGKAGMRAYVTDALAPTFLGILVGGGAVVTPCFYNGTNWISE